MGDGRCAKIGESRTGGKGAARPAATAFFCKKVLAFCGGLCYYFESNVSLSERGDYVETGDSSKI